MIDPAVLQRIESGNMRPKLAKKAMNYDPHNPSCGSCTHFKRGGAIMTSNSRTKIVHVYCVLGHFNVQPGSCCDLWRSASNPSITLE